jgi:hypothetical protein
MSDEIRLSAVTLDCPDAVGLAGFYAGITGGTLTHAGNGWACVLTGAGRINFQTVPGYTPPAWPDPTSSIMMHLDLWSWTGSPPKSACSLPEQRSTTSSRTASSATSTPTRQVTRSA